jgi:2'-5' RNA ligase
MRRDQDNLAFSRLDEPHQDVYFIGISLPTELDQRLADLKWQLHQTQKHMLKPVLPHVTLLHPPSLQGILPSQLIPRIQEIAKRYLPMTIQLTRVGFFGPRICYIEAEALKLYSLQSQLVRLLPPKARELHYKHPYLPHVTIAQTYDPVKLDRRVILNDIDMTLHLPVSFTIDSVTCFTRIMPRVYKPKAIQ